MYSYDFSLFVMFCHPVSNTPTSRIDPSDELEKAFFF